MRKQPSLWQQALDHAVDPMLWLDRDGRHRYANDAAAGLLGYTRDELLRLTPADYLPDVNWPALYTDAVEHRVTRVQAGFRRRDGTLRPVELAFSTIGDDNEILLCLHGRAVELADTQAQRLKSALDNAPFATYLTDDQGNIAYANASACQAVGYSADELTQLHVSAIDPTRDRSGSPARIAHAKSAGLLTLRGVHRRRDGTTFPIEAISGYSTANNSTYACSIVQDITDLLALEQQHDELRFALEHATSGVCLNDETGHIRYANASACKLYGYTFDEITRLNMADLEPRPMSADFPPIVRRDDTHLSASFDTTHRRKDGTMVPVAVSVDSLEVEPGRWRVFSFIQDISTRKQTERDNAMLRFAIDHAVDSVFLYEETGTFLYVNNSACRSLGYSREELLRMNVYDIDPRVTSAEFRIRWQQRRNRQPVIFESRHIRRDGTMFPVEVAASLTIIDGAECACAAVRDISERKQALRRLEELRSAVENTTDAVYLYDMNNNFFYANRGACEALGYTFAELAAMNLSDIDPMVSLESHRKFWAEVGPGRLSPIEKMHRRKDGTFYPVEIVTSRTSIGGEEIITAVARDITERNRVQQELQAYRQNLEALVRERTHALESAQRLLVRKERLAALGQLTAVVAHELRNPLATIQTSLDILRDTSRMRRVAAARALERIERNISRCGRIIDELLDYARTRPLRLEAVVLDALLLEIATEYAFPEPITVETELDSGLVVAADPEQLRRCVINGLANACEAMLDDLADRPKRLRLRLRRHPDHAEILIDDTGPGIAPEFMDQIFEPLFSTKGFGLGLGLSIVEQIMTQHGGSVAVRSVLDAGTQMSLVMPITPAS